MNTTSNFDTVEDFGPYYLEYGPGRILDALYLSILIIVGTSGNLLVICSIIYVKRTNQNGNIFIINLALADLIVSTCIIFSMLQWLAPY